MLPISDAESFAVARQAARLEGTVLGPSGGLALAAALRVARRAGPDDVVVVVNPDSGRGRVGQLYDDQWMASIGFLRQDEKDVGSLLDARVRVDPCLPELLYVSPQERVRDAIDLMRSTAVSQLPVCRNSPPFALAEVVGAVDELVLMGHVVRDPAVLDQPVESVMGPALPTIGAGQPVGRAIELAEHKPRPHGALRWTPAWDPDPHGHPRGDGMERPVSNNPGSGAPRFRPGPRPPARDPDPVLGARHHRWHAHRAAGPGQRA